MLAVLTTWGAGGAGCAEPPEQAAERAPGAADHAPTPEGEPHVDARALDPDSALLDRYPSLAFYPALGPELVAALTRPGSPREILDALAVTLAPWRWPSASDWDRSGFIDLDADTPGFVTRAYARSVSLPTGRHDLWGARGDSPKACG